MSDSPEVKTEYLLCLKHFLSLIDNLNNSSSTILSSSQAVTPQELKEEIKRIEAALSSMKRPKHQN